MPSSFESFSSLLCFEQPRGQSSFSRKPYLPILLALWAGNSVYCCSLAAPLRWRRQFRGDIFIREYLDRNNFIFSTLSLFFLYVIVTIFLYELAEFFFSPFFSIASNLQSWKITHAEGTFLAVRFPRYFYRSSVWTGRTVVHPNKETRHSALHVHRYIFHFPFLFFSLFSPFTTISASSSLSLFLFLFHDIRRRAKRQQVEAHNRNASLYVTAIRLQIYIVYVPLSLFLSAVIQRKYVIVTRPHCSRALEHEPGKKRRRRSLFVCPFV